MQMEQKCKYLVLEWQFTYQTRGMTTLSNENLKQTSVLQMTIFNIWIVILFPLIVF